MFARGYPGSVTGSWDWESGYSDGPRQTLASWRKTFGTNYLSRTARAYGVYFTRGNAGELMMFLVIGR